MESSKAELAEPRVYHCAHALLPAGWATDVEIRVDAAGDIISVLADRVPSHAARRLRGAVVPGVANVHSHAHQRAMAGLAERSGRDRDSFWTWREVMYGFVDRMRPEDLQAIAAQLYVEMVKAGFTAVGEFQYLHHDIDGTPYPELAEMTLRCLAAAREVGLGFTALPVLYADGDFGGRAASHGQRRFLNDGERFLRLVEAVAKAVAGDDNASFGIAPHSLRAVGPELLREVLDGIRSFGPELPIHLHIAEQQKEVDDCLAWCRQRPVEWLLDHVELTSRWCAIHATHMTPREAAGLAASGTVAGLCPTTEANLGDGIFSAPEFLAAEGWLAIGSDSHITVDPAEDLRMLEYSQRLRDRARNVLAAGPNRSTGRSLIDRVGAGGARALGRRSGSLAAGHRADFVVLDTEHPSLVGRADDGWLDSWIFSAGKACVRDVVVAGEVVVADRHHPREQAILDRFRKTLDNLQLPMAT